jgi:hypothetical protein
MICRVLFSLFVGLSVAACSSTPARDGASAEVHALTGAHTRIVWVQGDGTDPYAMGDQLVLMGFDTDDGRGERVILDARGSYVKPMLTPRGDRVVYSTHPELGDPSVHIVNFDGSEPRRFDRGFALAAWKTPPTAANGCTSAAMVASTCGPSRACGSTVRPIASRSGTATRFRSTRFRCRPMAGLPGACFRGPRPVSPTWSRAPGGSSATAAGRRSTTWDASLLVLRWRASQPADGGREPRAALDGPNQRGARLQ